MIRWIFWDLGDVIFNEEYLRFTFYERLFRFIRKQRSEFLFSDLLYFREGIIENKKSNSPIIDIAKDFLPDNEFEKYQAEILYFYERYHRKYIKIVPHIRTILNILKKKYKLGIIANQPCFIMSFLNHNKLSPFFDAIYLSDVVGIRKPDFKIFKLALKEQKIMPEESIYIGNRIDHDIIPAMEIGIIPLQARFSMEVKGFFPSTTYEKQYYEAVDQCSEWPESSKFEMNLYQVIKYPETLLKMNLSDLKITDHKWKRRPY
ncbi:MAG: HAD family hydrolase [Calditrichia bacterium]|nr:HAD family hydrolase [Calditrichia bacterium]